MAADLEAVLDATRRRPPRGPRRPQHRRDDHPDRSAESSPRPWAGGWPAWRWSTRPTPTPCGRRASAALYTALETAGARPADAPDDRPLAAGLGDELAELPQRLGPPLDAQGVVRRHRDPGPARFRGPSSCRRRRPDVLARGMLAMIRYDATDVLRTIDVPAEVVAGDLDTTTLPEASQFMAGAIPRGRADHALAGPTHGPVGAAQGVRRDPRPLRLSLPGERFGRATRLIAPPWPDPPLSGGYHGTSSRARRPRRGAPRVGQHRDPSSPPVAAGRCSSAGSSRGWPMGQTFAYIRDPLDFLTRCTGITATSSASAWATPTPSSSATPN